MGLFDINTSLNNPSAKNFFLILISIILTDISILLDIPILRQIFGYFFLTILPGLLIVQIFKLNRINLTEKFVLSVGLSVSFLMFFGLLLNNLSLYIGYKTPLATIPLLISFNFAFIVLAIISSKLNKNEIFYFPKYDLIISEINPLEKAFYIVLILFPLLSIFGMHVMNSTNNNTLLIFLLFLIPIYIIFVCFFSYNFSKRFYPIALFSISISLILLLSLRSNYLIGVDIFEEHFYYRTTLNNFNWSIIEHTTLDACLVISMLPAIYQCILNTNPEFLFKILYSSLFSISPLIIYILSSKYVGSFYGFLTSCFFISQSNFLLTELLARTNMAILFYALALMTLFNDKINVLKKRVLFIIFITSCMVSHYSTTYMFFITMVGMFLVAKILLRKFAFKETFSFTITILFFVLIFLWYSQVTETAFNSGVGFIEDTFNNLNRFFFDELRSSSTQAILGKDISQKGFPHKIEFIFTWLTFLFIGIGIITFIRRYKEMLFTDLNVENTYFLKNKFEVTYLAGVLICSGLLATTVFIPYVGENYSIDRAYSFGIIILSVFFIIGGIIVAEYLHKFIAQVRIPIKFNLRVWSYLVILSVLIPYFLCVTGISYQMSGVPRAIILNSEDGQCDAMLIHDQDAYGAKWLGKNYVKQGPYVACVADGAGSRPLRGQCIFPRRLINTWSFSNHQRIEEYIYLRYYNVVNEKVLENGNSTEMILYADIFTGKNNIYDNGGSEVWR